MAFVKKWFTPKKQITTNQSNQESGFSKEFEAAGDQLRMDAMAMRNRPSSNRWIDQAGNLFSGAGDMASAGFSMESAQPMINQFLQAAQPGMRAIQDQLANTQLSISGRSGLGRGGSGDILAQSIAGSEAAKRQGDLLSSLGTQGLQFARNSFNQDIGNQMRVGAGLMGYGTEQRDFGINNLMDIGRVLQIAPKRTFGSSSGTTVGPKSNPALEWANVGAKWADAFMS